MLKGSIVTILTQLLCNHLPITITLPISYIKPCDLKSGSSNWYKTVAFNGDCNNTKIETNQFSNILAQAKHFKGIFLGDFAKMRLSPSINSHFTLNYQAFQTHHNFSTTYQIISKSTEDFTIKWWRKFWNSHHLVTLTEGQGHSNMSKSSLLCLVVSIILQSLKEVDSKAPKSKSTYCFFPPIYSL